MKTFIFYASLVALGLLTVNCGSSKKAAQETEIVQPCTGEGYTSGNGYIRAQGTALDHDMGQAKKRAIASARAEIATQLGALVKRVTDDYSKSTAQNENSVTNQRFEDRALTVVKQKLGSTSVICDKMMRTNDGKYRSYVCVELDGKAMADAISKEISNDTELRIDFQYEKFKELFEKEMKEMK